MIKTERGFDACFRQIKAGLITNHAREVLPLRTGERQPPESGGCVPCIPANRVVLVPSLRVVARTAGEGNSFEVVSPRTEKIAGFEG